MTVCIPTTDDVGAAARLSSHFGRAPFFTIVDVEAARAETVPNPRPRHEKGECDPLGALDGRGVDVVVCRGIGPGALERLRTVGIPVLTTEAWTVGDAVRAFREGRASRVAAGHGPGHGA
ncbi:MAG: NifB/NifX family molybdenum-iron cluster-binding protein [Gemmatimonadota bacterium]